MLGNKESNGIQTHSCCLGLLVTDACEIFSYLIPLNAFDINHENLVFKNSQNKEDKSKII